jgi:hypothetical protein
MLVGPGDQDILGAFGSPEGARDPHEFDDAGLAIVYPREATTPATIPAAPCR